MYQVVLIFRICSVDVFLFSDISALEKWNVSNGDDFSYMFNGCSSLTNGKSLYNWKINSNKKLKGMFFECNLIHDSKLLKKWKVSKKDFGVEEN